MKKVEIKMEHNTNEISKPEEKTSRVSHSNERGVTSATFFNSIANYLSLASQIIVFLYASTLVSIDQMGVYNLLNQIYNIGTILVLFGILSTITKFIPSFDQKGQKEKANQVAYSIVSLNMSISVVLSLIFIFFSENFSLFFFNTVDVKPHLILLSITFLFIPNRITAQLLISRFEIKKNFIGQVSGHTAVTVSTLVFLYYYRSISAFLLGRILGEAIAAIILYIQMIRVFGKPKFKVIPKELVIFSLPLFVTSFLTYFSTYVYNFIFNFYFGDYAKLGFLYYINIFFSAFKTIFDSFDQILIVYYGTVLNSENGVEKYREKTNQISKLVQSLSFIIFIFYTNLSPILIMFLINLFSSPEFYFEGTLTTILFGFYFIIMIFQYMVATLFHIENGSKNVFIVHACTSISHGLLYFIIIKFVGLVGIPIAHNLGYIVYLIVTYWRIKHMKPRFDKKGLKINLISIIPTIIILPLLVMFLPRFDSVIMVNLILFEFKFPLVASIIAVGALILSLVSYLFISRQLRLFKDEDKGLFRQFFNEKLANILIKIFVK